MHPALAVLRRCLVAAVVVTLVGCGVTPSVTPSADAATNAVPSGQSTPSNGAAFQAYLEAVGAAVAPTTGAQTVRRDALLGAMGINESLGSDADRILLLAGTTEAALLQDAAARTKPTASGAIILAVARPPVPALAPEIFVREFLAAATDAVGRPGEGTIHDGPTKAVASSNDGVFAANVEADTTVDALVQGSNVTLTVKRDVRITITESATGGQVYAETRSHTVVGAIDVCPTAAGIVNGSVENVMNADANSFPGAAGRVGSHATGNTTSRSTFQGHVDDSANLGIVTQDYVQSQAFRRTASAAGGPEAVHEGAIEFSENGIGNGVPASHDWSLAIGDHSATTGNVEQSGDVTISMLVAMSFSEALDYTTIDEAYVASQKLWRKSRCVMVASPTYEVESELVPSGLPLHTEDVDRASSTPFEAALKHRFGAGLTATITAELVDGKEKLTPLSLPEPPGTLTYEAPDEDGKDALVRLTSTSRQGIGTLILKFHTGAQNLKVTISGTLTTSALGISYGTKLTVDGLVLVKLPDGSYAGSAPATAEIRLGIADCGTPYVQTGTFKLTATREVVEDQALERRWTVKWDPTTTFTTKGVCLGVPIDTFTGSGQAGPIAGFMFVLGDLVFPERGGDPQHITKTQTIGASTNVLDATVRGEIVSSTPP